MPLIKNNITYTYPPIIHSPNEESLLWKQIIKKRQSGNVDDSRINLITWNNLEEGILEKSLCGIKHYVLGKDIIVWNNFNKFTLNINFLNKTQASYVMGLDSHDVIFNGNLSSIINDFENMDCDLLFNAEIKFYPNYPLEYFQYCKHFQERAADTQFCYLNSGAWIGRRDFCLEFFTKCYEEHRLWEKMDCLEYPKLFNCDQSVVHGVFQHFYPQVKLDTHCKIFQNIAHLTDLEISLLDKWIL